MASARKLPGDDVLLEHVQGGLSNREIAERYGVTGEAVRQKLAKLGVRRADSRPSHAHYLPWRLRGDHVGDRLARMLRAYSKRMQGLPLNEEESRQLEDWRTFMDGGNSVGVPLTVHYDRMDDEGFWLEPRRTGDRDYIAPPSPDEF